MTAAEIRKQPRRASRLGQGLVEMALVLPVILLVLIAIFDFSYYFFTAISVNSASRNAVRRAAMNNLSKDQIKQLVVDGAVGTVVRLADVDVTVDLSDDSRPGSPPTVNVKVEFQHRFFGLGWIRLDDLKIKSSFTSVIVTYPGGATVTF